MGNQHEAVSDQNRSPPDSPAQIAWSTLYYDYQVTYWMVSATLALSGGTQHRVGVDIPLSTLFAGTVSQSLEGTYNMLVSKDGHLMNAILGFTRLTLSDQDITLLNKVHLIMVQHAGEHLSDLINDVLEMSKVESGRLELQETTFNLHEPSQTLEGMIRLRAESKGPKVYFEIKADVPGCLKTDQRKLRQVLINLLSNAVKFARAGAIHLSSRCVARLDERLTLEFQVKDTGIGIPQADLGRLFEPFVQASTCNSNEEGTGLGLAISKQFAELMGGEISVVCGLGEGSRFCFTLQASSARSTAAEHGLVQRRVIGVATGQPRFRQLVVEDIEWNVGKQVGYALATRACTSTEQGNGAREVTESTPLLDHRHGVPANCCTAVIGQ